ncbi:GntR family transcriptional regulator [Streptomyces sp. FXJ1.4098]|nr:GntR family transcriptional regulator [Streptomyces sp. FXJ1.4098]
MARATGKSEAVYERLKGDIESLRLKPGAKLSEVQLGEELGASRTPVREAIRRLAAEGWWTSYRARWRGWPPFRWAGAGALRDPDAAGAPGRGPGRHLGGG